MTTNAIARNGTSGAASELVQPLVAKKSKLKYLNGEIFSVVSLNHLINSQLIPKTEAGAGASPPTITAEAPEAVRRF
jgi:hypothetical protein